MVDMVPAHSAMTVCQDSRISGSAAMADSSLCQRVIQSWASLRGSGMSGSGRGLDPVPGVAVSWSVVLQSFCPVLSKPASITMRHSSSSRAGP
jgi:hypothetical protein